MNYLRGAVNAISAPYQYYKDLNPSTLTGAIDVIVVRRPKDLPDSPPDGTVPQLTDEDSELVCSPFHVRFGKWQVLRPQDKKVDVFVNGRLVPFSMKIGEAGEAFFVFFETAEEIPDNLTRETGRFGAGPVSPSVTQEPEFLDLDASTGAPAGEGSAFPPSSPPKPSHDEGSEGHGIISRTTHLGKAMMSVAREVQKAEADKLKDKTIMDALRDAGREHLESIEDKGTAAVTSIERRAGVDFPSPDHKLLPRPSEGVCGPDVKYTDSMVFDMEGYHGQNHARDASDATLKSTSTHPRGSSPSETSSPNRTPGPSRTPSPSPSAPLSVPFPTVRATSEPPPDHEDGYETSSPPKHSLLPSMARTPSGTESRSHLPSLPAIRTSATEEYTWDWGNFPQKTPIRSTFGPHHGPGASVDLARKAKGRLMSEVPDAQYARARAAAEWEALNDSASYGNGGRLTMDKNDSTRFRVFIEGRTVEFEIAIVPPTSLTGLGEGKKFHAGTLDGEDEVEDEHRFEENKVDFERFLNDESVVHDDNLVLLWGDVSLYGLQHPPHGFDGGVAKAEWKLRDLILHTPTRSRQLFPQRQTNLVPIPEGGIQRTNTSASAPVPSAEPEPLLRTRSVSPEDHKRFAKTLRLTSDQLKMLDLKPGPNSVTFSLSSTGVAACTARLFYWDWTNQVVISDIDGTITKSDALGHVFTMIGRDWTHVGVAKLYTDICRNGYKMMYLTSRAIGQADSTREYLKGIKQNDYQLPEGPVIMSPDRLMASLHREVIMRKPEVFKMACLRDIQRLFGGPTHNPFYSGFGNRITDALSYRSVSVPSSRIFTIDSSGEVKMELLELAGYKSSYIHMTDLVDQMFPPINRKWAAEFTDFNYWRAPIQDFPLPDLSPPSPALSARSDTSNQSTLARLRNFSLVGGRQSMKSFTLPPPATEAGRKSDIDENAGRLRQMSSLERLGNTIVSLTQSSSSTAGSPHSSTPTLHDSDSEYDEEADDIEKARRGRRRRESIASMPGSLPGSNPGSDDEMTFGDDEEDDEYDGYEGENEDVPDEAFDEAIFAAGEMKNVDYI
uniref:DNA helicase (EC) n=1 Tax=Ganoderma boninense TaxID=34458 RepID=A0A5K1K606_9APHY|nr:DNA helicase (EC [Ganoderma boninense]